jgi:hypothetical protein
MLCLCLNGFANQQPAMHKPNDACQPGLGGCQVYMGTVPKAEFALTVLRHLYRLW